MTIPTECVRCGHSLELHTSHESGDGTKIVRRCIACVKERTKCPAHEPKP